MKAVFPTLRAPGVAVTPRVGPGCRGRGRAAILAALAVGLLGGGCERGEPPASRAPAPAPARDAGLALPALGATRVERRGDRYDIAASDARAEDALAELSIQAGFRVERGSGPLPSARRTVWLRDVSLERAVAAILAGVPHSVHHEFADGDLDPARPFEGRTVALARVTLGALGDGAERRRGRPGRDGRWERGAVGESEGGRKEAREADARGGERTLRAAPADAAAAERAEALAREAEDPDPDVRLGAVERLDPDVSGRARLERMLRQDASPEVRAAAAERLAEGDPFDATDGLLGALADTDPVVVEAAVRALEDVYDDAPDPRIRESIGVLREHRDADVRAAAEEFEAWIEE